MNEMHPTSPFLAPLVAVVEDTESVRRAVTRLLASADFRVREFTSAEDYAQAEIAASVSCLVLDIDLGRGANGLDFYERLLAEGRAIPVVFMSANGDPVWRQRAQDLAAKAYLLKPFDAADLLAAVVAATSAAGAPPPRRAALGDFALLPSASRQE